MVNTCQCGNGIRGDADLCTYCQSRLTHCKIDASGYKKGTNIHIPWCWEKDCRILHANCHECEHYSEEKILPEVE